jgi:hypothetical protein
MLRQEGESVTVIYIAYEKECCYEFEVVVTPKPDEDDVYHYRIGMVNALNKYQRVDTEEKFKGRYLRDLKRFHDGGFFERSNGKMILLDDKENTFWFGMLVGFLEKKGYQVRIIEKGQGRL